MHGHFSQIFWIIAAFMVFDTLAKGCCIGVRGNLDISTEVNFGNGY